MASPGARRDESHGHQHPDLREAALLVDAELAPAHIRGVVHLQHHVRQGIGVHVDGRSLEPHPVGMQIQHLVGLHQPALAPRRVHPQQVRRAVAGDPRAAQHLESCGHLHQPPGRPFVLDGCGFAHPPRCLRGAVPELQSVFVVLELARRQVEGHAAREVLVPVRGRPGSSSRTKLVKRSGAHLVTPHRWMPKPVPRIEHRAPEEAAGTGPSPGPGLKRGTQSREQGPWSRRLQDQGGWYIVSAVAGAQPTRDTPGAPPRCRAPSPDRARPSSRPRPTGGDGSRSGLRTGARAPRARAPGYPTPCTRAARAAAARSLRLSAAVVSASLSPPHRSASLGPPRRRARRRARRRRGGPNPWTDART